MDIYNAKIGFIGAGKVGTSLCAYIKKKGCQVVGFYSRSEASAIESAEITGTRAYGSQKALTDECDIVFITTGDGAIELVLDSISGYIKEDQIICHCSGSISCDELPHPCCSMHPLAPVSDKKCDNVLSGCFFTVEGSTGYKGTDVIYDFAKSLGNNTIRISGKDKSKYHAACVCASNLVIGLMEEASDILKSCGFDEKAANEALMPLFEANAASVVKKGVTEALTGPVERNDIDTVKKHLSVLSGDDKTIYKMLSKCAIKVAERRNPQRDYSKMEVVLK